MADSTATTPTTPAPVVVKRPVLKQIHAHFFLDIQTLKVSWSKIWTWIAAALGLIVSLHSQLEAAGITIPSNLLPYFTVATIASAVIAALRLRNTIQSNPPDSTGA